MGTSEWVQLNQDRHPGVMVKVDDRGERVRIVGVKIESPDGITNDDLRSLPLHRLETLWNSPENRDGKLVRATMRARRRKQAEGNVAPAPTRRQLRLARPSGGRYPDAFYAAVALLYRQLVANGIRPAPALAEANDVPVTTVHRWVKEARARALLAPARKAGATG